MKKVLFVNSCIRRDKSRTYEIAKHFIDSLNKSEYNVEEICLMDEPLECFKDGFFEQRERLIASGNYNHPRFRYAWQFKDADKIVIAAPFWDLSFPALLKVYIENLCVEGITFKCNESGCFGVCNADKLIYITTRGGTYTDSPMEMGAKYIDAMCSFFGIETFKCIAADGLDVLVDEYDKIMNDTKNKAESEAKHF